MGRQHLEHAPGESQDGDVEGAATEVVYGVDAFRGVVEAIGDCGSRRLVQQAQHIETGHLRRILGGLALRVVEIRGHGDDRADEFATQRRLGALTQGPEDFGRNFDRAPHPRHRLQLQHARRVDEAVRQAGDLLDVGKPASHEALRRDDGVVRIPVLRRLRHVTDVDATVGMVAHHRGQQRTPRLVVEHHGDSRAHRGHQRIGRAQVDPHRQPVLVGGGGHAGFGDLQQGHLRFPVLRTRRRPRR